MHFGERINMFAITNNKINSVVVVSVFVRLTVVTDCIRFVGLFWCTDGR